MFTMAPRWHSPVDVIALEPIKKTWIHTGDNIDHVPVISSGLDVRCLLLLECLENSDCRTVHVAREEADTDAPVLGKLLQLLDKPVTLRLRAR